MHLRVLISDSLTSSVVEFDYNGIIIVTHRLLVRRNEFMHLAIFID